MKFKLKDPGSAITHGIGMLLAVAGATPLIVKAARSADVLHVFAVSVFILTMILLYLASTLYHSVSSTAKVNRRLKKMDHMMIFVMIAGSYTPFCLISLRGAWGWSLFGVSWGLAAFGIAQELTIGRKSEKRLLSMILYMVMGWLVVVAMYPLLQTLPAWGLFWLVLGGLLYSGGIYWFINDEKIKYGHGIWHLFVLGGSLAQFICVYFYVV